MVSIGRAADAFSLTGSFVRFSTIQTIDNLEEKPSWRKESPLFQFLRSSIIHFVSTHCATRSVADIRSAESIDPTLAPPLRIDHRETAVNSYVPARSPLVHRLAGTVTDVRRST